MRFRARPRIVALAFGIGASSIALAATSRSATAIVRDPLDFRAFYCAGKVAFARADPYLAEPLRSCENGAARAIGLVPIRHLALPAPLPGHAIAAFGALSFVPFVAALALYLVALVVAFSAAALLASRLARTTPVATAAATALPLAALSIFDGQIVPFVVLSMLASAVALARGAPRLAAVALLGTTIEPHVGLPAIVALAIFEPESRATLALGTLAIVAVAIATLGRAPNVEYLARVLPAHARSEIAAPSQYSLTSLLDREGVPGDLAIALGDVSYAATSVLGVFVAGRLASRTRVRELVALLPPAFAVFGGPFVHLTQIAVAVPALVVLCGRLPHRRARYAPALMLLAIPWQYVAINDAPVMVGAVVLVSTILAATVWRPHFATGTAVVVALAALAVLERRIDLASPVVRTDTTAAMSAVSDGRRLAEDTWSVYAAGALRVSDASFVAERIPTYLGLIVLVIGTTADAIGGRRRRDVRVADRRYRFEKPGVVADATRADQTG